MNSELPQGAGGAGMMNVLNQSPPHSAFLCPASESDEVENPGSFGRRKGLLGELHPQKFLNAGLFLNAHLSISWSVLSYLTSEHSSGAIIPTLYDYYED